jgi:taurine dioxygenase
MGSILHLHTVPASGGDTLFASMCAAQDARSARMKSYLGELVALHDAGQSYRRRAVIDGRPDKREYPHAGHPVIRTRPVTGRKAIFVSPAAQPPRNSRPTSGSASKSRALPAMASSPETST